MYLYISYIHALFFNTCVFLLPNMYNTLYVLLLYAMYYSPQRQAHPHGLLYAELGPMPAPKRNTQSQKKPSQYVDVVPQDTPQIPSKASKKGELFYNVGGLMFMNIDCNLLRFSFPSFYFPFSGV